VRSITCTRGVYIYLYTIYPTYIEEGIYIHVRTDSEVVQQEGQFVYMRIHAGSKSVDL